MPHAILAALGLLAPMALDDGPKLGAKFKAAVARAAKEADAVDEGIVSPPWILINTGNARALAGDKEGARADLRKAALMLQGEKEPTARVNYFTLLGLGLARAGDAAGSRAAFREALQATDADDSPFRAQSIAEIAVAQARGGDKAAARATFVEALRGVEAPQAGKKGEAKDFEATNRLATILGKQVEAGLIDEALQRAEEDRLIGSEEMRFLLLDRIGEALAARPRAERRRVVDWVRRQADTLKDDDRDGGVNDVKAEALGWVARWEAKLGDVEAALKVAGAIGGKDASDIWRLDALLAIAEARVDAGDKDAARGLLRDVFTRVTELERATGISSNSDKLIAVAWGQARIGDVEGASRTAAALAEADERPDPAEDAQDGAEKTRERSRRQARINHARGLAALAAGRAGRGDADGARRDIRAATDLAGAVAREATDDPFQPQPWKDIAAAQALAGDVPAALKTAELAVASIRDVPHPPARPDPAAKPKDDPELPPFMPEISKEVRLQALRNDVLGGAVDALLKAGDRATALRVVEADPSGFVEFTHRDDLIASFLRAGDLDGILALFDRIPAPAPRAAALLRLAEVVAARQAAEKEVPKP